MNSVICPTVTAETKAEFDKQVAVASSFAKRIHFDLMDGDFAPSISQSLKDTVWPKYIKADLHLMYKNPMKFAQQIIHMHPNLVIVHAEADAISSFVYLMHEERIKVGIALLQDTDVSVISHFAKVIDQVLVFSGHLGYHGGVADLNLLKKVEYIKNNYPELEIAWDGGINDKNINELTAGGVNVLNVGGYIQKSDQPKQRYETLMHLVQSR